MPALARRAHRSQLIIGERTDNSGFRLVWQVESEERFAPRVDYAGEASGVPRERA
jgi:hypothetical protein